MLTIDIGNSRIKWGVFKGASIQFHGAFAYNKNNIEAALNQADLIKASLSKSSGKVLLSCVAGASIQEQIIEWLKDNGCTKFEFAITAKQQCGITNSYKLPTKMGVDRWLAMIAANKLYGANKGANNGANTASLLCVIDCGTAITLDVLSAKGGHLGGLIFPGYQTMLRSLGLSAGNIHSTQSEPLNQSLNTGLGVSTEEAVSKGCAQIISAGIRSMLVTHAKQNGFANCDLNCVITGGDGDWLAESFKLLEWQAKVEPYLVLQGLYYISL